MWRQDIFVMVAAVMISIFTTCMRWLNLRGKDPQLKIIQEAAVAVVLGMVVGFLYLGAKELGIRIFDREISIYFAFIAAIFVGWEASKKMNEINAFASSWLSALKNKLFGKKESEEK